MKITLVIITLCGATFQMDTQYSIIANNYYVPDIVLHADTLIHFFLTSTLSSPFHKWGNWSKGKAPCSKSQLVNGEVRIQTQSACLQNSHSKPSCILPLKIWLKIYHSSSTVELLLIFFTIINKNEINIFCWNLHESVRSLLISWGFQRPWYNWVIHTSTSADSEYISIFIKKEISLN